MPANKMLVDLWLEAGCSQEEGEVSISWRPINFSIYSDLFQDMIRGAVDEWLAENKLPTEQRYELIFRHVVDHDGGGAVLDEHFELIHEEHSHT